MPKPQPPVSKPEAIASVWRAVNHETAVYVTSLGTLAIEQTDGLTTQTVVLWVSDLEPLAEALKPLVAVAEAIRVRGAA